MTVRGSAAVAAITGFVAFVGRCCYRPTVARGVQVALIVGPILTAINQFDVIADRDFGGTFFLKLALTFTVPFCVSVTSSTLAALKPIRRGTASE